VVIDGHPIDEFPAQVRNSVYDFGAQPSLTLPPPGEVPTRCQRLASRAAPVRLGGSLATAGSGRRYQPYFLPAPAQAAPSASQS
jgi:hypothetical protein